VYHKIIWKQRSEVICTGELWILSTSRIHKSPDLVSETTWRFWYGVASISRLLKMIGLFCKRALLKRRYSAKETYHFKEPTHRSHPIVSWDDASLTTAQNIVSFIGLFCKSDLYFKEPTHHSHPIVSWDDALLTTRCLIDDSADAVTVCIIDGTIVKWCLIDERMQNIVSFIGFFCKRDP